MPCPPRQARELEADHAKQLVSYVVPVGVVELLEVIDVHHGDRAALAQCQQGLVEGTPSRKLGQLVPEDQEIGALDL